MTSKLRDRLTSDLTAAMRERDLAAVRVLRATIAAIDNAQAPPLDADDLKGVSIEASPRGTGTREVARLSLTEDDIRAIIGTEIAERREAADGYDGSGQEQRARDLRAEATRLAGYL
ncbi:MAG TPA: hypothetical protein VG899_01195 [Mycobacteriales bacterium]|nr:hypothetical protein [Mycobacteriales bacterium]